MVTCLRIRLFESNTDMRIVLAMMVRMEIIQAIGLITAAGISVTGPDMIQGLDVLKLGN